MSDPHTLYRAAISDPFNYQISSNGALIAYSGDKTGRSPDAKRIVLTSETEKIWWGDVNKPISPELYNFYLGYARRYFDNLPSGKKFIIDAIAGWDPKYQLKVRIYALDPYHALFMRNMLIPVNTADEVFEDPDFIIYNLGSIPLDNVTSLIDSSLQPDHELTDTLVAINPTFTYNNRKRKNHGGGGIVSSMIIYGTRYAGEMKKGILTLMMYLMPLRNALPLHSSANIDPPTGESTLFFGLSGTGKTTLSTDPNRLLIGDDEHVWTPSTPLMPLTPLTQDNSSSASSSTSSGNEEGGIFNIEGGCYAKCINLDQEKEPDIYQAIRYGAVLENVVIRGLANYPDYKDYSITMNTRASYPLDYISKVQIPAIGTHPTNLILLTCDASGVLPPIARLTPEQAVYHFLSGYTSKITGTEVGVKEPMPTFSACFGEPFIVWHPQRYGELLQYFLRKYRSKTWLVNTGWIGGSYGSENGRRISLKYSREIVNMINKGCLGESRGVHYSKFPLFEFDIPDQCGSVPEEFLNPRNSWENKEKYDQKLKYLYDLFQQNWTNKIEKK